MCVGQRPSAVSSCTSVCDIDDPRLTACAPRVLDERTERATAAGRTVSPSSRSSIVREHRVQLESPSRVSTVRQHRVSRLRQRTIPVVVRVAVVNGEIHTVPGVGLSRRIAFLQLYTRQQDQLVEEVIVDQAEAVDVDLVIVLLEAVSGSRLGLLAVDRWAMLG